MSKSSSPTWRSWTGMVYYGETFGFVAAWVAGVVALSYAAAPEPTPSPAVEQVAAVEPTDSRAR